MYGIGNAFALLPVQEVRAQFTLRHCFRAVHGPGSAKRTMIQTSKAHILAHEYWKKKVVNQREGLPLAP